MSSFTIPVQVISEANCHDHWAARRRRKKTQQDTTFLSCCTQAYPKSPPKKIILTRIYPSRGKRMDDDNLAGSFKHVQDEIARFVRIDDGKIDWTYQQERGDEYGVRVEFEN